MKLYTGREPINIEFPDENDTGTIYFNPTDPDLMIRFKAFQEKVDAKLKDLPDVKLDENGNPESDELVQQVTELRKIICDELDIAFNGKVSDVVFKYCNPLTIVDGEYYIVEFIKAVTPEMESIIKASQEKANKQLDKHIAKYVK